MLGINPYVDVPPQVSKRIGKRGYVPVIGTVNGRPMRATLVPRGEGLHRLFINGAMRKAAGVDVGDTIEVGLEVDREPRDLPMPPDLKRALAENDLLDAFDRLTPSDRRYVLAWLASAKKKETWERRVEVLAGRLARRERPSEAFGIQLAAVRKRG